MWCSAPSSAAGTQFYAGHRQVDLRLSRHARAPRLPRRIRLFEGRAIAQAVNISRQVCLARKIGAGLSGSLSGGHTCLTEHDVGRTEIPGQEFAIAYAGINGGQHLLENLPSSVPINFF